MAVISSDRNRSFIAGPLSLATNAAGFREAGNLPVRR